MNGMKEATNLENIDLVSKKIKNKLCKLAEQILTEKIFSAHYFIFDIENHSFNNQFFTSILPIARGGKNARKKLYITIFFPIFTFNELA